MNPLLLAVGLGMGGGVYANAIQYNNSTVFQQAATVTAVTPDDNNPLPVQPCNRLYVGVTGDVAIKDYQGNAFVYKSVPAGSWINTRVRQVYRTGTTAGNMGAEY